MRMLKTYWLELLFFAVGLAGAAFAFPLLPGSIPRQWNNGQVVATMPKAALFLIPVVQLLVCYLFHWWIGHSLEKLPALAPTFSGMERLLPAILAVVCLSLELCIMLAAWDVAVDIAAVLLIELLLVPIVFIGFVAAKILGYIGKLK